MGEEKKGGFGLDDDDNFTVYNRDDIVGILRGLIRNKATLSAVFNGGSDVVLTQVLEVDPDENVIYLDTNANAESNNNLLLSKRTFFVSISHNSTVKWLCEHIQAGEFEGYKAFRVPIPEKLKNIQRRGVYRIATPIVNPVMCRIPLPGGQAVNVPLVDVCVEGVGVVLPPPVDPIFARGANFKNCILSLPEIGDINVTMSIQAVWEVTMSNGLPSKRAGLIFMGINAREQSMVQRYVHKLDCLRIATLKNR
jgi:c-di-GMP-binding flagellar brake protein YcgR